MASHTFMHTWAAIIELNGSQKGRKGGGRKGGGNDATKGSTGINTRGVVGGGKYRLSRFIFPCIHEKSSKTKILYGCNCFIVKR